MHHQLGFEHIAVGADFEHGDFRQRVLDDDRAVVGPRILDDEFDRHALFMDQHARLAHVR